MRHRGDGSPGFALYELLLVVGFLAVLAGITIPIFFLAVSRARMSGVAESLGAAIRDARTRAIATGWSFRVHGFNAQGAVPDAFRIEGMDPNNGGAFPPDGTATTPPSYGGNQMNEGYVVLAREFGAAQLVIPGGGNVFTITFASNGQAACAPNCQVQVTSGGRTATLNVSVAGAVRIDK